MLTLYEGQERASENTALLNAALLEGDVVLDSGVYYVDPGILVDGVTLDLNGSQLIMSVLRHAGSMFGIQGHAPGIINGTISGLYAIGKGDPGWVKWENEGAIRFLHGGFEDALIEDLTLNNFGGWAIGSGAALDIDGVDILDSDLCIAHNSPVARPTNDLCYFRDLDPEYPYVTAREWHYFAVGALEYVFYDSDGNELDRCEEEPAKMIAKPNGTAIVSVSVPTDSYERYKLYECKHTETMTINRCTFRCNQRLGIANLLGESVVSNCASISNGYPREDHTGIVFDDSTSGFMDIEDSTPPYVLVKNCTSSNENLGVWSRAYNLEIQNCGTMTITVDKAWSLKMDSGILSVHAYALRHATIETTGTSMYSSTCAIVTESLQLKNFGFITALPSLADTVFDTCSYYITRTGNVSQLKTLEGTFKNCTFRLNTDFVHTYSAFHLTLENCVVYNGSHFFITNNSGYPSTLQLINCRIQNERDIANGGNVTVLKIDDGGEDEDTSTMYSVDGLPIAAFDIDGNPIGSPVDPEFVPYEFVVFGDSQWGMTVNGTKAQAPIDRTKSFLQYVKATIRPAILVCTGDAGNSLVNVASHATSPDDLLSSLRSNGYEYDLSDGVGIVDGNTNFRLSWGNHEARAIDAYSDLPSLKRHFEMNNGTTLFGTGASDSYYFDYHGDRFIIMHFRKWGMNRSQFTKEDIELLEQALSQTDAVKRVFLFEHSPDYSGFSIANGVTGHTCGRSGKTDTQYWGGSAFDGISYISSGEEVVDYDYIDEEYGEDMNDDVRNVFRKILQGYVDANPLKLIWFHGHTHKVVYQRTTYNSLGNVSGYIGTSFDDPPTEDCSDFNYDSTYLRGKGWTVHVPSLGNPQWMYYDESNNGKLASTHGVNFGEWLKVSVTANHVNLKFYHVDGDTINDQTVKTNSAYDITIVTH